MKHPAQVLFEHAVASYDVFQVMVNPKVATLPSQFDEAPAVTLNIEPNNPGNNRGFRTSDEGFETLMSFDRTPAQVLVPWAAFMVMVTPGCVVQFAVADTETPKSSPGPSLKRVK